MAKDDNVTIYIQPTLQMLKPEVYKETVAVKATSLYRVRVTVASHQILLNIRTSS